MGATASLLNASDIQARVTKELVSGIFAKHNTPFSEELYQDLSEFANELELLTSNLSEIEQSVILWAADDCSQTKTEKLVAEAEKGNNLAKAMLIPYLIGDTWFREGLNDDREKGHDWTEELLPWLYIQINGISPLRKYALFVLGICYASSSLPQDFQKSMTYLNESALAGLAQAQFQIGVQTCNIAMLEKAAHQNFARAQDWLADMYYTGDGVPVDRTKAKLWYERAAAQGLLSSMASLETKLFDFQSITQVLEWVADELSEESTNYLIEEANAGNPLAKGMLIFEYSDELLGPRRAGIEADVEMVKKMASDITGWLFVNSRDEPENGMDDLKAHAQYILGVCYYLGASVQKDRSKAFVLWDAAAAAGVVLAQFCIKYCEFVDSSYTDGEGGLKREALLELNKLAAEDGNCVKAALAVEIGLFKD